MTAAVTRELSIVYGTLTIGGTTDRLIDGKWKYDRGYEQTAVECEFVTTAATEAAFATEVAAVEAAFATPRARLRVIQGSQTLLDFDPSTNSGFNATPQIVKVGNVADTGRSRRYRVRITVDMPADLSGQNGRRSSTVEVSAAASGRRTMRVTGVYTALSGNSARTQYAASIDAYAGTLIASLGGTWELVAEPTAKADDTDKVLEFDRVYQEIVYAQSSGGANDSEIFDQRFLITRTKLAPGDDPSKGAQRLVELAVSYSASIAKGVTDIVGKWENSIRPYILAEVQSAAGTGSLAVIQDSPQFNYDDNKIAATMSVLAVSGSSFLAGTVTTEDRYESGKVPVPVWDGGYHTKYMMPTKATTVRRITRQWRELSGGGGGGGGGGFVPDLFQWGAGLMGGVQQGLANQMGGFGIGNAGPVGKIMITPAGGGGGGNSGTTGDWGEDRTGFDHWMRGGRSVSPMVLGLPGEQISVLDHMEWDEYTGADEPASVAASADSDEGGPLGDLAPQDTTGVEF
uniref:Uncharacterized protein n=1 Tax=uncultured marine virus TaxID=186617 RepID=A0A0F7L6D1_9VIRU|nr:hypothetical protein [uncultured marine virus]